MVKKFVLKSDYFTGWYKYIRFVLIFYGFFCSRPGLLELPIDALRHPNGPSLAFFPFPVIDSERPWGSPCGSCSGNICTGHYITNPTKLLELQKQGKAIRALPPSKVISEHLDASSNLAVTADEFTSLAKKCCLSVQDVKCWIEHKIQVTENQKRGAQKAKETRAQRKQNGKNH